jgi:membrane protein implicated in regulation of membrane protease activity
MLRAAVFFIAAIAGTVVLVVAGSLLLERRFSNWEVASTFISIVVLLACWLFTARQRRHSRRRLHNLRDSALW